MNKVLINKLRKLFGSELREIKVTSNKQLELDVKEFINKLNSSRVKDSSKLIFKINVPTS